MDLAAICPVSNENNYIARIRQIPVLSSEEERALAIRYQETGDLAAAQTLVVSHLRYVVYIAQEYRGYGLAVVDLIQEGALGLMKAVKRFDPTRGFRLVTFAVHWIKSAIHDFIIQNWRIVKVATTKAQRKLFFNLRRYRTDARWLTAAQAAAVAQDLGVKPSEVLEMEQRLYAHDASIEGENDTEEGSSIAHMLIAPEEDTDGVDLSHGKIQDAIADLDPRSRDILEQRWMRDEKTPLKELAVTYGVSLERIRQIEKAALAQVTAALEH